MEYLCYLDYELEPLTLSADERIPSVHPTDPNIWLRDLARQKGSRLWPMKSEKIAEKKTMWKNS